MQPTLTTPTVPAVQMPVMLVAEVQDSLLVVVHDELLEVPIRVLIVSQFEVWSTDVFEQ